MTIGCMDIVIKSLGKYVEQIVTKWPITHMFVGIRVSRNLTSLKNGRINFYIKETKSIT